MKEICIVGLGYIGLPTAAIFARNGYRTFGVDRNEDICRTINDGKVHIIEPGLDALVGESVEKGFLHASCSPRACKNYIVAVPTPIDKDKKADLSYVIAAARDISRVMKKGCLVILESTVPPGCTELVLIPALEKSGMKAGLDFHVAHCPERVLPGKILDELVNNDRIIGGIDALSSQKAKELYASFVKGHIHLTDTTTAETCKLMENTFRDVNIALANELAVFCENAGISAWEVIRLANLHPRVHLHEPGPGVGGHCIAVDPWFMIEIDPDNSRLIRTAREFNASMPARIFRRIRTLVPSGGKITILGCTYKPDVDDIRESPILELAEILLQSGYSVTVTDPYARLYGRNLYESAEKTDLIVLGVHHSIYRDIDLRFLASMARTCQLYDLRNFFHRDIVEAAGFKYIRFGEPYHG